MDSNGILNALNLTEHSSQFVGGKKPSLQSENTHQKPSLPMVIVQLDGEELYAIPQKDVVRLEEIPVHSLSKSGGAQVIPYNGKVIQVIDISSSFNGGNDTSKSLPSPELIDGDVEEKFTSLICNLGEHLIAIKVQKVLDMCEAFDIKDDLADSDAGILGHFFYMNSTVSILEVSTVQNNLKVQSENQFREFKDSAENAKAA